MGARRPGSRRADERGAALVELALLLIPLCIVAFGIVDLGRAYEVQHRLSNATREAGAVLTYSPTHLSCADGTSAVERARAEDASFGADSHYRGIVVTLTHSGTTTKIYDESTDGSSCDSLTGAAVGVSGDTLTITGTYRFDVLTPLISRLTGSPLTMTKSVAVRVQ